MSTNNMRPALSVNQMIEAKDLTDLKTIHDVKISPDGRRVASVLEEVTKSATDRPRRVILLSSDHGESVEFDNSWGEQTEPCWSSQGEQLAFFSLVHNQKQLVIWHKDQIDPLINVPRSARQLSWSPDGRWFSFLCKSEPVRQQKSTDVIVVGQQKQLMQLWIVDVSTMERRMISGNSLDLSRYTWSPDSSQLVGATRRAGKEELYLFDLLGNRPQYLTSVHDMTITLAWSPDGKTIAWCGREHHPDSSQVMTIDMSDMRISHLLHQFAGSVKWLDFLPDGRMVFAALQNFRVGMFVMDVCGHGLEIWVHPDETKPGSLGSGSFSNFSFSISQDGQRFATARSGPDEPGNVVIGEWKQPLRVLTQCNPKLKAFPICPSKEITWKADDGLEIHGLFIKPTHSALGTSFPVIVELHGGPRRSWWDTCYLTQSWAQFLASRGYGVFLPNPRGSSGRGAEFVRANSGDLGGRDLTDVLTGVDHLVSIGWADPDRLGICGWSYGGYLTAWAITQTQRFRAAIVGAAMVNWISWEGQTSMTGMWPTLHWQDRWIAYRNPEKLQNRSPIQHVKDVQTPTLILHGMNDRKVPIAQADEWYRGLTAWDVPVKYVKYPREGHVFTEQSHQFDVLQRIGHWFDQYII